MHLERRTTLWQGSDRAGRILAVINVVIAVINLGSAVWNATRNHWWAVPVGFACGVLCLGIALSALRHGFQRDCARWVAEEERRKANWRWN